MKTPLKTAALSTLALALLLGPVGNVGHANEVGSVAAVNRDIEATPPGADTRSLLLGDRLIANERLVSSPVGSGQVLFLDQTSLTVSPNSNIVLDEYVYDPSTEVGQIGITVASGVMRLVGGRITKTNDALIRTPSATIGIRGGIALVAAEDDGETTVMHIAGEYTKVSIDGSDPLTLSRANAFARTSGGSVEFLGVATPSQIARFYGKMQGGGGGTDQEIDNDAAEESGVADANSEEPNTVTNPPISTAGESPAEDGSAETLQLNIASDTNVTTQRQQETGQEPAVNPFANFIGGILLSGLDPVFDDQGELISDPAGQNFLFGADGLTATSFEQGSLITTLEDGSVITLPTPTGDGVFAVDPSLTSSPEGQLTGAGFADSTAGLLAYYLESPQGERAFLLGANPGPTQLRTINSGNPNFRVTTFNILPDLHIASSATTRPFLPEGIGEIFDTGVQQNVFLVSVPNQDLFAAGSGFGTNNGSRWLLPQFAIIGSGENQNFLLSVGATSASNNGANSPDMSSFARGSLRLDAQDAAFRIQQFAGTTGVGSGADGGTTVFGANDNYLVLGNSSSYHNDDDPADEISASFFQNIQTGEFGTYGNLHLAQRAGSQDFAQNARLTVGTDGSSYALETGRTGAGGSPDRFLSFSYSANAASFRDSLGATNKLVMRSAAFADGGAAVFESNGASAGVVMKMDESIGVPGIGGATLAFGGNRSAVIDSARFGLRDANNVQGFENVLLNSGENSNVIQTIQGDLSGRPDDQFGQAAWRGALLGHGLADAASLYPAGTDITPEFLTWGWWTGQFRFADNDPSEFQNARLQYALGTWVAGDRTNILPITGLATFNGAVTVNFMTNTNSDFVDGGRFQLDWDFAAGSGSAGFEDVGNLPNFVVPVDAVSGVLGVNDYGGDTIFGPNMTSVRVDGSFFDGPVANDARATAGSIRIDELAAAGNVGVGTFFGER